MIIYSLFGAYVGLLRNKNGGGWLAGGKTRSDVIHKLLTLYEEK